MSSSKFLNRIEAYLPAGCDVHSAMDNYGTHKVEKVRRCWRVTRAIMVTLRDQRQVNLVEFSTSEH